MKFASPTLLLCCLCLPCFFTAEVRAVNPLEMTGWELQDSSFQAFPFDQFAQEISIFELGQLSAAKKALDGQNLDGGQFLSEYLEYYLRTTPPNLSNTDQIDSLLLLATQFHGAGAVADDPNYWFQTYADRIFTTIAQIIQQHLDKGTLIPEDINTQRWMRYLEYHQYLFRIEISDVEKGLHHMEQGNWSYLMERVWEDHKGKIVFGIILGILGLFTAFRLGYARGKNQ